MTVAERKRILIIDDEADLRFMWKEFLDDSGLDVLEADNGLKGLEIFRAEGPDMVVCDLRMPECDGLEVLSAVTSERPESPVVVIAGAGSIQDVIEALRRGAWDYLVKPVTDMEVLLHVIDKALERSRLLKLQREYHLQLEREVRERTEELQNSRESYREKSELLETLLRHLPLGVCYLGMDGVFVDVNDSFCRIFGLSRALLIGRPVADFPTLAPFDFLGEAEEHSREVRYGPLPLAGKERELSLQKVLIHGAGGRPAGVAGLVRDITESSRRARKDREREQQLIQADKMISLGILTAGVAHEINNPNHLIMLALPLIEETWQAALPILDGYAAEQGDFLLGNLPFSLVRERLPETIRSVAEGSERIKGIVQEMKDFSRLDSEETRAPTDLNRVLGAALRLLEGKLKKTCRNLQIEVEDDLPLLSANGRQLEQVIINLLLNAAEALPDPDKAIRVATRHDVRTETVLLRIEDEGEGISEQAMAHLFDPFFTTKRETGGTGLGLAISQRIVRKHGGEIRFESNPGKGTAALVVLPLRPKAEPAGKEPPR